MGRDTETLYIMPETEMGHLLDIYKLHAELADRVSQRRQAANRQYVSLHVGLLLLVAAILRFGFGEIPAAVVIGVLGLFGVALSLAWIVEIRSYRQLNREKFRVLHQLESHLPFQFFRMEWDSSLRHEVGSNPSYADGQVEKNNSYWRLTHVENGLPVVFTALHLGAVLYSFCVS